MRGADGVEAVLLQNPHAALLALRIGRRAENAAVVVNAAAAQQRLLPVDKQSFIGPGNLPDAEGNFDLIVCAGADPRGVKIRIFAAPELRLRNRQVKIRPLAGNTGGLCLHGNCGMDMNHCGIDRNRADLHALRAQPVFLTDVQPDRAVDAGAGIPTGVRHAGIICCDRERVFRTHVQLA